MPRLNVKVGLIGPLDMLKFKNMGKVREQAIQAAPANEVVGTYKINENAKALHPDHLDLKVVEIVDHKDAHAKSFIFKEAKGRVIPFFRAGQYLSLKFKVGDSFVTRPYSISSGPAWTKEGMIAITVQDNPKGFAAPYLYNNVKVGDVIKSSAPEGTFVYEPIRDPKHIIAVAGGSGITPFLSMAYAIRDGVQDFDLTILFGSRTESAIILKEELEAVAKACKKVHVVNVLSDEEKEGYEHGFITADLIKKYAPKKEEYAVFACGPEAMYKFLDTELPKLGIPRRHIRKEIRGVTKDIEGQTEFPKAAKGKEFKVKVIQGAKHYDIVAKSNEPLLVAIERAGIVAPSKCRGGECGWCRSKLVSGTVYCPKENEFRRWADVQNNYIHPCSTFPTSDLVVEVPGEFL